METQVSTIFSYNKTFAYGWALVLFSLLTYLIARSISITDRVNQYLMIGYDLIWAIILVTFYSKYLKPAILQRPALELTPDAMIDYEGNRVITWRNIKEIKRIDMRYSSVIAIYVADESGLIAQMNLLQRMKAKITKLFYGTSLLIPLQYISGDNAEIVAACNAFRTKQTIE